jgi:DNA mismatch repair protein MutS2
METELIDFNESDLEDLGFFKTLDLICAFARTLPGKNIIRSLRPLKNSVFFEKQLSLVIQMADLKMSTEGFYLPEFNDLTQILMLLRGKTPLLEPHDLSQIAVNLRASGYLRKRAISFKNEYPLIKELFNSFSGQTDLLSSIEWAIGPEEEVLSRASAELKRVRAESGQCKNRVKASLKKFIANNSEHIQDDIISTRSFRYVVLLKSGSISRVKGLVHDQSGSGRAVYFEPLETVDLNNTLSSLFNREKQEVMRILSDLSRKAAAEQAALASDMHFLSLVDALVARADFHKKYNCAFPLIRPDSSLQIIKGRHPLLGNSACAVDLEMPDELRFLLISGPNAGGKSVTLKMAGLFPMMLQSGITIPASPDSSFPVFEQLFTDIGDKQSIEDSLSTFSSHIVTLNRILRTAGPKSLVIIDEICDGTDPQEGTALAMAVMTALKKTGALCIITSHYGPLKVFAMQEQGAENAAMTFDSKTLRPRYSLKMGLPGKSYGLELAQRYGISEHILAQARQNLGSTSIKLEDLLEKLDYELEEAGKKLSLAQKTEEEAQRLKKKYEILYSIIRKKEEKKIYDLYEKTKKELDNEKARIRSLAAEPDKKSKSVSMEGTSIECLSPALEQDQGQAQKQAKTSGPGKAAIDKLSGAGMLKEVKKLRKKLEKARQELKQDTDYDKLVPGTEVYISSLTKKGTIIELRRDNKKACCSVGPLKIDVPIEELILYNQIELLEKDFDQPFEGDLKKASFQNGAFKNKIANKDSANKDSANKDAANKEKAEKAGILKRILHSPGDFRIPKKSGPDSIAGSEPLMAELDIRGEYTDNALQIVDSYLYRVSGRGLKMVRIIHGKGTGRLREAVTRYLHDSPIVKAFRPAGYHDGGLGATIVEFWD